MKTYTSLFLFFFFSSFSFAEEVITFDTKKEGRVIYALLKYQEYLKKTLPKDHPVVERVQTGIDTLQGKKVSYRALKNFEASIRFGDVFYSEKADVIKEEKDLLVNAVGVIHPIVISMIAYSESQNK